MKLFTKLHFTLFITLMLAATALSQDLPDKIRGYKVYKGNVAIFNAGGRPPGSGSAEASVTVGEPTIAGVSLTGITVGVPAEILASGQSGNVHFLSFHDFRLNGVSVDVEEYNTGFEFKANRSLPLPRPVRIFLRADRILKTAYKEITEDRSEWLITGRVFVFGKFKKMGFSFKRVVPVNVSIKIKNPLIDYKKRISG
jgi:hypothetical protein